MAVRFTVVYPPPFSKYVKSTPKGVPKVFVPIYKILLYNKEEITRPAAMGDDCIDTTQGEWVKKKSTQYFN